MENYLYRYIVYVYKLDQKVLRLFQFMPLVPDCCCTRPVRVSVCTRTVVIFHTINKSRAPCDPRVCHHAHKLKNP